MDQKKYPQAIKNYRMALDQTTDIHKSMRLKILQNTGIAFVRMGRYPDAITSFENIMEEDPNFKTGGWHQDQTASHIGRWAQVHKSLPRASYIICCRKNYLHICREGTRVRAITRTRAVICRLTCKICEFPEWALIYIGCQHDDWAVRLCKQAIYKRSQSVDLKCVHM